MSTIDRCRNTKVYGKNIGTKIQFVFLLTILISLVSSSIRQFLTSNRIENSLAKRKVELEVLERKNEELRAKLEEVKRPGYLSVQAQKMLGTGTEKGENLINSEDVSDLMIKEEDSPMYKQWLDLFLRGQASR